MCLLRPWAVPYYVMLLQELTELFADDGLLAGAVEGYRQRPSQLALAQAIHETLMARSVLVAEAGTGTGKTWAYLVPALLSGARVLVSTGTRTLQDQLYHRDLPRLRQALALPVSIALLKGRGNYVCHYHLGRLADDDRALKSRDEIGQLRSIQEFTRLSRTGDRAELAQVPEDADIWHRVTSTRENCLGQNCPHVRDCFVLKARRQAQEADLVVVNHALFMADLALREEGVTDLLPSVDLVVFDEAHQLPDTATRFLGISVSSHQLLDLARTVEATGLAHAREATNWSEAGKRIEHGARSLRLAAAPLERMPGRRATYETLPDLEQFEQTLDKLIQAIDQAGMLLDALAERHPDLAAAGKACVSLRARLVQWRRPATPADQAPASPQDGVARAMPPGDDAAWSSVARADVLPASNAAAPASVRWVELGTHFLRLHSAPLSVAGIFSRYRRPDQAWVLTSATLSVHGDFTHFLAQLGLSRARTERWESPFDYPHQGLLYVPRGLPLPSQADFTDRFAEQVAQLLPHLRGGALILCTTLRAVDRIAEVLLAHERERGAQRSVLRQGDGSRARLLERFRSEGNAVLVGSASFWEGIDVPGQALALVAIDKLPFAPPDDPVLEARLTQCREQGGNPFMAYQVPQAAIALKQGAGRLIRSEDDSGVLMVGDTRLVDKPYGRLLWRGLPPFARTRDAAQVLDFLQRMPLPAESPAPGTAA